MFSRLISLILFCVALILSFLACVLPDWIYFNDAKKTKSGLWVKCDENNCKSLENNGSIISAKIFSIATIVGLVIVVIMGIKPAFFSRSSRIAKPENNIPFYVGVLSTLFAIVTIILNTTSNNDTGDSTRGSGFYLEIMASAASVVASILIFNPIKVIQIY